MDDSWIIYEIMGYLVWLLVICSGSSMWIIGKLMIVGLLDSCWIIQSLIMRLWDDEWFIIELLIL